VNGHIAKRGAEIEGVDRKEVKIPSLVVKLPYPAGGMNTAAKTDKKNTHLRPGKNLGHNQVRIGS
jgi:hypothetical protein